MTLKLPDIDIDIGLDRDKILSLIPHTIASKITENSIIPHNVGVYFNDIPKDYVSGLASIDYKKAEEYGIMKIDLIHNTIYDDFNSMDEINTYLNMPINWSILNNKQIVEQLPHISSYYDLIQSLPKIDSIEKLAYLLAIIRPSKTKYIDLVKTSKNWECVKDIIWVKEDDKYMYKKSHAIAFAHSIVLVMNKIGENL